MNESQNAEKRADEQAGDERVYRIAGLVDLVPDCLLPPESKEHIRNARREMLLAARGVVDAWIDRLERGTTVRRTPTRIEIE